MFKTKELPNGELILSYYIDNKEVANVFLTKVDDKDDIININSLWVSEKYRNRKIGTNIVEYIVKNYNSVNLELGVYADNEFAIKIYKKCGFKVENTFTRNNLLMYRMIREKR